MLGSIIVRHWGIMPIIICIMPPFPSPIMFIIILGIISLIFIPSIILGIISPIIFFLSSAVISSKI